MPIKNLHFIPLAVFVLFPSTFIIVYIIAVELNHVDPDFPYVSDSATEPPESCVFGQLLNIGAILLSLVVIIRYYQVQEYRRHFELRFAAMLLNSIGLVVGVASCIAISLVANFQITSAPVLHVIAAWLSFSLGTVYCWIQAVISCDMYPKAHGKWIMYTRMGLSIICALACIVSGVTGLISHDVYRDHTEMKRRNWFSKSKSKIGWQLHNISSALEWVVGIAFSVYMLTFVPEFRRISIDTPMLIFQTLDTTGEQTRPIVT